METYAQINENNEVVNIIVADAEGIASLSGILSGTFVDTSLYDFSKKPFPAIGNFYYSEVDAFLPLKPYPSWTLDEDYQWIPPSGNYPTGIGNYEWNEETLSWIESNESNITGIVLPSGWPDAYFGLTGLNLLTGTGLQQDCCPSGSAP